MAHPGQANARVGTKYRSTFTKRDRSTPANGQQGANIGRPMRTSEEVAKFQTYEDTQYSPKRVAGAGIGGIAAAYGIPRTRLTNRALEWGENGSSKHGRELAQGGRLAQRGAMAVTKPLGMATSHLLNRTVDGKYWMGRVPHNWRMFAVAHGGAYLLARSLPIGVKHAHKIEGT